MEIDLNACGDCCLSTETSSCSSNGGSGSSTSPCSVSASSSSIYLELWHACAGPLTSLPKKGSLVVYFPQGHLEQVKNSRFDSVEVPTFDLPPQILCRVVDVQLLANKENDEVYTQLSLHPLREIIGVKLEEKVKVKSGVDEDGNGEAPVKSTSHMFCKTLTASDTSSHGGFSVPRRAAEDCFPPLNYDEQRPCQELIASDLHGVEWKFRHIYRGQPRRHLLTTGWSMFVSQKKLASGDAVLFLRGETGDLRLGIRRATRPGNGLPNSIIKNQKSYPNILFPVANAVSSYRSFDVFCSPRISQSDFVVPYEKYLECLASPRPVGTRFKMRFDLDDSPERRFSGVVTGVSDADPFRWPNSKWRCLMVRWDDMSHHQERVSPWDVEPSSNYAPPSIQPSPRMKRLRPNLEASPHASPISRGVGPLSDLEEHIRSSKVLQGQENVSLVSPLHKSERMENPITGSATKLGRTIDDGEYVRNQAAAATTFTGFLKSNLFPKVLQGQEIFSYRSLAGKTDWNLGSWSKPDCVYNGYQVCTPGFYPLASEGARSMSFPHNLGRSHMQVTSPGSAPAHNVIYRAVQNPPLLSKFSDFQAENHVITPSSIQSGPATDEGRVLHHANESRAVEKVPICKLFGYSLTEDQSKRSCTKVHKQGSLVGRAIDLSRLHGYEDLLTELERLFSMEGLLRNPKHGWRILYTDSENDMMVVGDDPWNEFVKVVSKIHIYTQEEVEKLNVEMNIDDTQSCLEEAPPLTDLSKSSSVSA